MKIIQIAPVLEYSVWGESGEYSSPRDSATVYGLGDDGKVYAWNVNIDGWVPNHNLSDPNIIAKDVIQIAKSIGV